MAKRTGTQLKADLTTAEAAVATAVATPSDANINAAVVALEAARLNANDSHITATRGGQELSQDVEALARAAKRELRTVQAKGGTDAEKRRGLQRSVADGFSRGLWHSTKDKTTTD